MGFLLYLFSLYIKKKEKKKKKDFYMAFLWLSMRWGQLGIDLKSTQNGQLKAQKNLTWLPKKSANTNNKILEISPLKTEGQGRGS